MNGRGLVNRIARDVRAAALATACAVAAVGLAPTSARGQEHLPSKVEIAFNRYHDYAGLVGLLREIAAAYPELARVETIGRSLEGREMVVVTVSSPKTARDRDKPAMWIDANVHGNEIQGGEVVLYSVWYLTKAYGVNAEITRILDEKSFYFLPSQNPDGRDAWFHEAQTSSSSRASGSASVFSMPCRLAASGRISASARLRPSS